MHTQEELDKETQWLKEHFDIPAMTKIMLNLFNQPDLKLSPMEIVNAWEAAGYSIPRDLHTALALVDICRYYAWNLQV